MYIYNACQCPDLREWQKLEATRHEHRRCAGLQLGSDNPFCWPGRYWAYLCTHTFCCYFHMYRGAHGYDNIRYFLRTVCINGSLLKPECYEYMDSYSRLYNIYFSTINRDTEMFVFPNFLWAAFYFEDTHASHICRSHGPDVSGGLPLAVTTLAGRHWGSTRDSHPQRFWNHCTLVRMMYSDSFIPWPLMIFELMISKFLKVVLEQFWYFSCTCVYICSNHHKESSGNAWIQNWWKVCQSKYWALNLVSNSHNLTISQGISETCHAGNESHVKLPSA